MPTFRTSALAAIDVAGRKIGTIAGWVEHEAELSLEVLQELKGLVDAGIAVVQFFHPQKGWSPDVSADDLAQGIAQMSLDFTDTSERSESGAESTASGGAAEEQASDPAAVAADPSSTADPAAEEAPDTSKPSRARK